MRQEERKKIKRNGKERRAFEIMREEMRGLGKKREKIKGEKGDK